MFPQQQFQGQGPSSPGALRVPPGAPGYNPVNRPTSSCSTPPPGPASGTPGRLPISHPTNSFLPPAEERITDTAWIADLPPLPEICYDEYDADDKSDDLSDLGSAEGKPPNSLKQTQFSLKQFATRTGQADNSEYNKRKKGWVADQENINRSRSNTQSSQTLWATSPVLLSTFRCSQTPLVRSTVLSDSVRAFSGAPENTWSDGGALTMLRALIYRIVIY
jgi:hypothetical protein